MSNYDNFSAEKLRKLFFDDKIKIELMTEEDFTALLDLESSFDVPNDLIIDFCIEGLSKLPKYHDIHTKDFSLDELLNTNNPKPINFKILRKAVIALIAAILTLCTIQLVGSALGFDLFGYIINWNKTETVDINSSQSIDIIDTSVTLYDNIQDMPLYLQNRLPSYLCENFTFVVLRHAYESDYFLFKNSDENIITFSITTPLDLHIEKDDNGYHEEYIKNDITYNILTNMNDYTAFWIIDNEVYVLSTPFTDLNEFKAMLDNF